MNRLYGSRLGMAGLICMLLLAACGSSGGSPAASGSGGILRIGMNGTTGSLDPFSGQMGEYSTYTTVYPLLATYNLKTLAFQPDFAKSWKTSSNGLTWTFQTQPNAKWSDGKPLTANDAAWTLGTIAKFKNGPTAGYASYVSHLKSAVARGPNTLVLTYDKAVSNVLAQAGSVQILPEHVWARYAAGDGSGLKTFANEPSAGHPLVSGGPFELTSHRTNDIETFVRNPDYYGPRPLLDGFDVKFYSSNDSMVTALKTGQIDAIDQLPTTDAQTVKAAGMFVSNTPGLSFSQLTINTNPVMASHRELLNPMVREAFEYAVDRQQIANVVYVGYAQPGNTIEPPAIGVWHDPNIPAVPFDIAKANQLLDQAGFPAGPGGVRQAHGQPMSYRVLLTSDLAPIFQILQADFRKIGVNLTAQAVDSKAETAAITANKYTTFTMALDTGGPQAFDPDYGLSTLTCADRAEGDDTGYCNPTYDSLYSQQGTVRGKQRVQVVYQMQELIHNDRPLIVLDNIDNVDAWNPKWTGFAETPNGIFTFLSPLTLTGVHRG